MSETRTKRFSIASRIALRLTLLSVMALTLCDALHLLPDGREMTNRRRAVLCEFLAITSSVLAEEQHETLIARNFEAAIQRFPEVRSARIRRTDGSVLHQVGDHPVDWSVENTAQQEPNQVSVPIHSGDRPWATVEICFEQDSGLMAALLRRPVVTAGLATLLVNLVCFRWYLTRAFRYLDPTQSVPDHVRSTLDTFAEGVLVMDTDRCIVLVNDKLKRHLGRSNEELLGHHIDNLPWQDEESLRGDRWDAASRRDGGIRLALQRDGEQRTYLVSASPVLTADGQQRGTIASFDDITELEEQRTELNRTVAELQESQNALQRKNTELEFYATRDALTGCLNRRTFFEFFEQQWSVSKRHKHPLTCIMLDVDHFKSVNDNYGHGMGDRVLQGVAVQIQDMLRRSDLVCRYGGEEFCVLLPETPIETAAMVAEKIRCAVARLRFNELQVTVSLGISAMSLGADNPEMLLDEADQCLYIAKRAGRNQVIRWDHSNEYRDAQDDADAVGLAAPEVLLTPAELSRITASVSRHDPSSAVNR